MRLLRIPDDVICSRRRFAAYRLTGAVDPLVEGVVHSFQSDDALDLPDWPSRISLSGPMSCWPAVILSLLFCVVLGLAIHWLIFRPLRDAPVLAKVVASVGLLLVLQAIVIRRFTLTPRAVRPLPFVDKDQVDLWIL